jgi:hypothetical protein
MAYPAITEWLEDERNEFIDQYLEEHPDATEFEAALIWATQLADMEQEPRRENI